MTLLARLLSWDREQRRRRQRRDVRGRLLRAQADGLQPPLSSALAITKTAATCGTIALP